MTAGIPEAGGHGLSVGELFRAVRLHNGRPFVEAEKVRTPLTISSGPWSNHLIRRARKMTRCDDRCGYTIMGGELYVEGDVDPYRAGGFGHDRLCLKCAGTMAIHTVAEAIAKAQGTPS